MHSKKIIYQHLKPGNVLVCNRNYCNISDPDELMKLLKVKPTICRLTDFGEARSSIHQTQTMATTKTNLTGIGTVPFMAPEILPDGCLTNQACLDDLFKVDVWALGMTLFCLLNSNLKYPFKLGLQTGRIAAQFIGDQLNKDKNLPTMSNKYHSKRLNHWSKLYEMYLLATTVNLKERPAVNKLISPNQQRLEYHSLNCSQHTSLVDYSENIIRGEKWPFPDNDGTNACTFLCYKIANIFHVKINNESFVFETSDLQKISDVILEYPRLINPYRNIGVLPDALEVKSILEKVDSMVGEAELSEKIGNNVDVFSNTGIQNLITSIKFLGNHTFESVIYTCYPYSFIISANPEQYPVNSNDNGNALVILSEEIWLFCNALICVVITTNC